MLPATFEKLRPVPGLKDPATGLFPAWEDSQYEDRDTTIRVTAPENYPEELKRRAVAVANDFMLRVAATGRTVKHYRANRVVPYSHHSDAHVIYSMKISGVEFQLWFKPRFRGRDTYDRKFRNRLFMRYGSPKRYYGGRHGGPKDFDKTEGLKGFRLDKLVPEVLTWVDERKEAEIREAEEDRKREAREKREEAARERQQEVAKRLQLAFRAAGYGDGSGNEYQDVTVAGTRYGVPEELKFDNFQPEEIEQIIEVVLEALVTKRIPWKTKKTVAKVTPLPGRGALVSQVAPPKALPRASEPHVVSEPSTEAEIAASDNKVIREAYEKAQQAKGEAPKNEPDPGDPFSWCS